MKVGRIIANGRNKILALDGIAPIELGFSYGRNSQIIWKGCVRFDISFTEFQRASVYHLRQSIRRKQKLEENIEAGIRQDRTLVEFQNRMIDEIQTGRGNSFFRLDNEVLNMPTRMRTLSDNLKTFSNRRIRVVGEYDAEEILV